MWFWPWRFSGAAGVYVYCNRDDKREGDKHDGSTERDLGQLRNRDARRWLLRCLEAVYEQVNGVERVESGYTGGQTKNPTYRDVCGGNTGHAEVIQIAFDPKVISYRDILQIFFVIHDPTTLNRQGADAGTQYRSVIFYHSPEQKQTADKVIEEFAQQKIYDRPIVTQVQPAEVFYRAEEYHQGYFRNNPGQGYCRAVVAPKVSKLRNHFASKLEEAVSRPSRARRNARPGSILRRRAGT